MNDKVKALLEELNIAGDNETAALITLRWVNKLMASIVIENTSGDPGVYTQTNNTIFLAIKELES